MSCASASSSSAATLSTAPARACMRAPPSCSLSGVSPMPAMATTGGPATNSWARAADDHREVRADDAGGAEAGDRAERGGHHGHAGQIRYHQVEAGQRRHVREAHLLERLDRPAAAGAVDEPHERYAQVVREPLGVDRLLPDRGVGGAAANGEVVALHDGAAPVDAAMADDRVGGQEICQLPVVVVGRASGERAGLVEAARVEQPVDALAHGQATGGVLAGDALLAAHPPGQLLAPAKLLELGLPAHCRDLSARRAFAPKASRAARWRSRQTSARWRSARSERPSSSAASSRASSAATSRQRLPQRSACRVIPSARPSSSISRLSGE